MKKEKNWEDEPVKIKIQNRVKKKKEARRKVKVGQRNKEEMRAKEKKIKRRIKKTNCSKKGREGL